MRRLLLAAAVMLSGLALTACDSGAAGGRAAPPADYVADVGRANCVEARVVNEDGLAAFESGAASLREATAAGDRAAVEAAESDIRTGLTRWADTLVEMSGRPYAPANTLADGAATIQKIADPADDTPVEEARETLAHVGNKLRAACATDTK
ncbi:hypothetical protein O7635_34240 [Asanoa sp. WMMD1127]|uniref:hypothetical protein n=1 Tax=Asanoa sp. WMMD1127 TaxID=3016107 RepID=UPI00241781A4|nr:hypothetical protein [Asanoa sp. WMMD1127]MDG4826933.1 hypothetical protein [Asanoa sp. WMMD1127]